MHNRVPTAFHKNYSKPKSRSSCKKRLKPRKLLRRRSKGKQSLIHGRGTWTIYELGNAAREANVVVAGVGEDVGTLTPAGLRAQDLPRHDEIDLHTSQLNGGTSIPTSQQRQIVHHQKLTGVGDPRRDRCQHLPCLDPRLEEVEGRAPAGLGLLPASRDASSLKSATD